MNNVTNVYLQHSRDLILKFTTLSSFFSADTSNTKKQHERCGRLEKRVHLALVRAEAPLLFRVVFIHLEAPVLENELQSAARGLPRPRIPDCSDRLLSCLVKQSRLLRGGERLFYRSTCLGLDKKYTFLEPEIHL